MGKELKVFNIKQSNIRIEKMTPNSLRCFALLCLLVCGSEAWFALGTCGDKHYQKELQVCCGETIHFVMGNSYSCCGEKNYDSTTHKCQNGKIVERA
ncbi:Hypothetical predicted protein [Octopus vulgaris]|uniref:Galaxin-like repeats domain-containing protein n=1 Tax=Octopus vulgaris TaxID=6645 RepID=A0AA36AKW2_OCTVU|nr:Hypothetical predicted protein [Octopus vulgaris]